MFEGEGMHHYVTMLHMVGANGTVEVASLVREFELEMAELDEFLSWAESRCFIAEISDAQEPCIAITPAGSQWVLRKIWDFFDGESTGELESIA